MFFLLTLLLMRCSKRQSISGSDVRIKNISSCYVLFGGAFLRRNHVAFPSVGGNNFLPFSFQYEYLKICFFHRLNLNDGLCGLFSFLFWDLLLIESQRYEPLKKFFWIPYSPSNWKEIITRRASRAVSWLVCFVDWIFISKRDFAPRCNLSFPELT